jgi:hypothetical protein
MKGGLIQMKRKQLGIRLPVESPEYQWCKSQKNIQQSLTRLIDIAIVNWGSSDLVDSIINEAVKNIKDQIRNPEKKIDVELSNLTDSKLKEYLQKKSQGFE